MRNRGVAILKISLEVLSSSKACFKIRSQIYRCHLPTFPPAGYTNFIRSEPKICFGSSCSHGSACRKLALRLRRPQQSRKAEHVYITQLSTRVSRCQAIKQTRTYIATLRTWTSFRRAEAISGCKDVDNTKQPGASRTKSHKPSRCTGSSSSPQAYLLVTHKTKPLSGCDPPVAASPWLLLADPSFATATKLLCSSWPGRKRMKMSRVTTTEA